MSEEKSTPEDKIPEDEQNIKTIAELRAEALARAWRQDMLHIKAKVLNDEFKDE